MNLAELFKMRDFPTGGRRIMLARHTLNGEPDSVVNFVKRAPKNFEEWQSVQSQDKKKGGARLVGCDFVVAFCGIKNDGVNARFAGVFRNLSNNPPDTLDAQTIGRHLSSQLARIYLRDKDMTEERFFFKFRKESLFADLEGRVVIDWGRKDPINWAQEFTPDGPETVLEVTRKSVAPFCG